MGLLGKIMKTSIETIDGISGDDEVINGLEVQKEVLEELLHKAGKTAFGKYYGFQNILDSNDLQAAFRKAVPIFDYESMNREWWSQQQKLEDITWPGKPKYFALTSGTTGNTSKRIPVTEDYIKSTRSTGLDMIKSLAHFDLPEEFFEKEVLMLSSSSDLKKNKNHFQEGEISGINVHNFPEWYDLFYRPGKEIASTDSWDERLKKIVEKAPSWDIGSIAGLPSWVLMMLKAIVKHYNLKTIHDIWPNFKVFSSGGVAFETYRKSFEQICGEKIHVLDTYLASEGFFAYTSRPNTLAMKLALDSGFYYEFIPFDDTGFDEQGGMLSNPVVKHLGEVEKDKEYALIVSSCSGAWRYFIGDTIRFTNLENYELLITGRTKFFLNVVGAQLSEEKMDEAILETSEANGIAINEYAVAALKDNDDYYHMWVLVSDDDFEEDKIINDLDALLKEKNKNYRVARTKALKGVKSKHISKRKYHEFLEQKKQKGGQVKTPKVMSEHKMQEFLDAIGDK